MAIQLNHTIVPARDAKASATFLTEILGLPAPVRFGPFWAVKLQNGVTLDYQDSSETMPIEHYAFLVSEAEFDAIFERIRPEAWNIGRTRCTCGRTRSIVTTVDAACIGMIRTVITWKSSRARTAAAHERPACIRILAM